MAAIEQLFQAILSKITAMGAFASVTPALRSDAVVYPAAEVWLAEDKQVADSPAVTRDLTYVIQITAGHREDNAVQTVLHPLLDTLRSEFSNWLPDFVGLMPATVPVIKIASHEDHGKTVYVLHIVIRVYINTFRAKS